MKASDSVSHDHMEALLKQPSQRFSLRAIPDGTLNAIYGMCLAVAIFCWFTAIRAPLWLDETVSFSLIRGGLRGILSRQLWPDSQAYSCLLWLWTRVLGSGEITLRISSVIPMLGATFALYCAAREMFRRDVAMIAAIVFCLHSIVSFAAIDVRPYAFAILAVNLSILILVRSRSNNSYGLAALFGFSSACIVQFQLLFLVIVPALAICFVALKSGDRKLVWRQFGVALVVFAVVSLAVVPRFEYMYHTSGMHVFDVAPQFSELASTLALRKLALIPIGAVIVAALTRRLDFSSRPIGWPLGLCASLALVPILALYFVSKETSIHVFVPRYRLVAIPGIALCWALIISRIDSRTLRLLFCVTLVGVSSYQFLHSPIAFQHAYSWKDALEAAQENASVDHATLLICSDLPEADHMPMPTGSAIEDSGLLAPISYYRVNSPVVALPRTLNAVAIQVSSRFVQEANQRHERFLALGYIRSYEILDWIAKDAAPFYDVSELGVFDEVKVLEFTPRNEAHASR